MFLQKKDQFIKIQLGNLTPECEDLFKDTLFAPIGKNKTLHQN